MHLYFFRTISLSLALCAFACGPAPTPLVASWNAPAAEGEIKTDITDNGNTKLDIRVKHLARPEKVEPGALVYVVWVAKDRAAPQNIGALVVDEDLSGRLVTVTPLRTFFLTITAEADQGVTRPRGEPVLSAKVSE